MPPLVGDQSPRILKLPAYHWHEADDAAFLASAYGMPPDEWQLSVLRAMLGRTGVPGDHSAPWSATTIGLAVPRQNGKNAILEMRELFGLVALGERILHTAHQVNSARAAFFRILSFFEDYPELTALTKTIRRANGQEQITLHNGGSIQFAGRSPNNGRGLTFDLVVLDEAQQISDESHESLGFTTAASPNPQKIYTGTPPGPKALGAIFTRIRQNGCDGVNRKLAWLEWSAEAGCDCDDRKLWAATNPGMGIRINEDTIADERIAFSTEAFERERLGVWHDYSARETVIDMDKWADLADRDSGILRERGIVLAVDISPRRDSVHVALCGAARDGRPHVEVIKPESPSRATAWAADFLATRAKRFKAPVVIDSASPAMTLVPALRAKRIEVIITNVKDMASACGMFWDAVENADLHHLGQEGVDTALIGARRRKLGDSWGWSRKDSAVDISPLVAFTLAHYGWRVQQASGKSDRITMSM